MTSAQRQSRYKRLSADLPQHWLDEPWFLRLSDDAKLLYMCGLMWAIGRTDGRIPSYALPRLCPDDVDRRARAVAELVRVGKWKPYTSDGGGWRYPDWTDSQSTVEQIEHERRRKRQNQADSRAKRRPVTGDVTGDLTGEYVTEEMYLHLGEANTAELASDNGRVIDPVAEFVIGGKPHANPPPEWDCADGDCPEPEEVSV
jgi:hypothetical protein